MREIEEIENKLRELYFNSRYHPTTNKDFFKEVAKFIQQYAWGAELNALESIESRYDSELGYQQSEQGLRVKYLTEQFDKLKQPHAPEITRVEGE